MSVGSGSEHAFEPHAFGRGSVALVTGATAGLGFETTKQLASMGATVILGVRNADKAVQAVAAIKKELPDASLYVPHSPLDLGSLASVRSFAQEINKEFEELHVLINNAGVSYGEEAYTEQGVGVLAQVNYLGPYLLTRLLEKKLVASKARVVAVSSITHRMAQINDEKAFLTQWKSGRYRFTKLANTLFAYELQRRLGPNGLSSVVADPGCVASSIFDNLSPRLSQGMGKRMINASCSPPQDGCKPIVHAATVAINNPGTFHYFSRGLFSNPFVTHLDGVWGRDATFLQNMQSIVFGPAALSAAVWDWPFRRLSRGCIASQIKSCRSSSQSYDPVLARNLWVVSAEFAGIQALPPISVVATS